MTTERPVYYVTASRPGSDVAGETAAALAAGAVAFKDIGGKVWKCDLPVVLLDRLIHSFTLKLILKNKPLMISLM